MDGFIIILIQKYGWGALILGIISYLVLEGGLDIATDLISHKIIKNKERKDRGE